MAMVDKGSNLRNPSIGVPSFPSASSLSSKRARTIPETNVSCQMAGFEMGCLF